MNRCIDLANGVMMSRELIKISEFQHRVWGENGTPLSAQAIRNQIRNDELPGERVGKLWFIDWTAYRCKTGNDLVDSVLRSRLK